MREVLVAEGFHLINRRCGLFCSGSRLWTTTRPQEAMLFPTAEKARQAMLELPALKQYGEYENEDVVRNAIDEQYDVANWQVVPAFVRIEHGEPL